MRWDLIKSLFNPVDVWRILQIPLNYGTFDDFTVWNPDPRGYFLVKSTYRVQWTQSFWAHASTMMRPGGPNTPAIWSTMWKLKVPRKVQIFCWRVLHGIIPLKSILTNRHIGTNAACPVCHQDTKDIRHLLFDCNHARELWRNLGIVGLVKRPNKLISLVLWLWSILY